MNQELGWTIVQHSATGYAGKPGFEHGLETRSISTKAELAKVIRAGGFVFDSYSEAEDKAFAEMYPADHQGMIPRAPGQFSNAQIDGLAIYVPLVRPKVLAQ